MVHFTALQSILLLLGKLFESGKCPLTSPLDYPQCRTRDLTDYDFIVVGAGPAGCTIANRLSENPDWKILLVEAGGYPTNESQIPELFMKQIGTPEDWLIKPEIGPTYGQGFEDKQSYMPQGKVLGGSSGINGMMFTEGIPSDYDRWKTMGNKDWGYKTMKKYFHKLDMRFSDEGYVPTNKYESPLPARALLIAAAQEIGFPVNQGVPVEFRDVRTTMIDNVRCSMARAYLTPIKDRPNLCVLVNTVATKILIDSGRAIGVALHTEVGIVKVFARKEVIVTAGPLNSPKLLMLSGIGPRSHLRMKGIKVVKDLPVGYNHKDHAGVLMYIRLPPNATVSSDLEKDVREYCTKRTGPLSQVNMGNFQAYINTQGLTSYPDIEFMHAMFPINSPIGPDAYFNINNISLSSIMTMNKEVPVLFSLTTLLVPKSHGFVRLRSKNPFDSPVVYPNYLTVKEDKDRFLGSVAFWQRILNTSAMDGSDFLDFDIPNCNHLTFKSTEYWLCYFQNFATSFHHHTGTCRMGPEDDYTSVVDPELKVWGLEGLRVCDTSAFPTLISGHTMIPAVAFAEHAADIIKRNHRSLT